MAKIMPQSHSVRCFKALACAATDARLSRGDLGCLAVILDRYNVQEGAAWPSITRLASEANLATRNVVNSIRKLVEHGYLEIEHGGIGKSNRYRPTFKATDVGVTTDVSISSDADITARADAPPDADIRGVLTPASPEAVMPASIEHTQRTYLKNIPNTTNESYAAVLESYHRILPKCRHVTVLNDKRRKRIQMAIKLAKRVCRQQGWEYTDETFWTAYFNECSKDPWMRGDVPHKDNPSWKQNLDVLLAEDRFAGIMDRAIEALQGDAG